MEFLSEYGLFLAKVVTVLVAVLVIVGFIVANRGHGGEQGQIRVSSLNERYDEMKHAVLGAVLPKHEFAHLHKQEAKQRKQEEKQAAKAHKAAAKKAADTTDKQSALPEQAEADAEAGEEGAVLAPIAAEERRKRVYVLKFDGDIKASPLSRLREEITAILQVTERGDEVVVCLESPGGMVANYGLAASQLARVRSAGIQLTIAVDKVAASGGYMMACVADRILAAPFAMIGSIGVVAQLPNFNRLLKSHDVDFEMFTAGEYKRTVTMFGENTEEGREKFQSDLEEIHELFQHFVSEYRPALNIGKVATGEVWFGQRAMELGLIDEIQTSDEYLTGSASSADLYLVEYKEKHNIAKKIGLGAQAALESAFDRALTRLSALRHQAQ